MRARLCRKMTIRQYEECAWPLFENGRERGREVFRDSYPKELHLDSQHLSGSPRFLQGAGKKRIVRVPQHSDVRELGHHFPEQLQPFPFQFRCDRGQPRHVPAWPREARDEAHADGIADGRHDDRDRRCRLLDGERGGRAGGNDHVHLQGDQFGDEGRKALILSFRPAILDQDVSALDVAEFAQPFAERPDEIGLKGSGGVPEETDPGHLRRLLLLSGQRRGEKAAGDHPDERAPLHHWVLAQVFCESGVSDRIRAWSRRVGSMQEPSLQAGWESSRVGQRARR